MHLNLKTMRIVHLFAAGLILISCNGAIEPGNTDPTPTPQPEPIPVNIALSLSTRATDTAYENGDQIGLYMVYGNSMLSSGNYINNKKYTLSDSKWKGDDAAYWKDETTTADFYCYHPYAAPSDALAYEFSVKADQTDLYNYKASDFLWGKTVGVKPSKSPVSITTAHIMSNMVIDLVPGAGFTKEEFDAAEKSVTIGNVALQATINLSTGGVIAKGEAKSIKAFADGGSYKAIVVPQSVAADTEMLIVTVAGVTYTSKEEFTFKPQTRHQMTVTVDKIAAGLDITIEDWKVDNEDHNSSVN